MARDGAGGADPVAGRGFYLRTGRHPDGDHVHVNQELRDRIYRRLRTFRDAETFERVFDGDWFSRHQDWADDLDDLGAVTLPEAFDEGI